MCANVQTIIFNIWLAQNEGLTENFKLDP